MTELENQYILSTNFKMRGADMKQNKKIIGTMGITIGAVAMLLSHVYAASGTVASETVRMREKPTTQSAIVINLDKDDKVDVIEQQGDWYKIKYDGKQGYVSKDLIKVDGKVEKITSSNTTNTTTSSENKTSEEESSSQNTVTEEENNNSSDETENKQEVASQTDTSMEVGQAYPVAQETKLYGLPVLSSSDTMTVPKGEKVTVLDCLNRWVYVETAEGNGWMLSNMTTSQDQSSNPKEEDHQIDETKQDDKNQENTNTVSKTETESKDKTTTKVGYVNTDSAYIRRQPDTSSEAIDALQLNDKVTILGEENNWYQVQYGDSKVKGYIAKKLISSEKTKTTSRSMTAPRGETVEIETQNEAKTAEKTEQNNTANGDAVVAYAKTFLHAKYVSGGNGPTAFDCSGFTKYVYQKFGYSLNRTAAGQASNGTKVNKDAMQKGDLLLFYDEARSKIGHVGIYIGNQQFIHAANASRGVVTDSIHNSYYAPRLVDIRRIL